MSLEHNITNHVQSIPKLGPLSLQVPDISDEFKVHNAHLSSFDASRRAPNLSPLVSFPDLAVKT